MTVTINDINIRIFQAYYHNLNFVTKTKNIVCKMLHSIDTRFMAMLHCVF